MLNQNQLMARAKAMMQSLVGKPISGDNLEKMADIIAEIEHQAFIARIDLPDNWDEKVAKSLGLEAMWRKMYG